MTEFEWKELEPMSFIEYPPSEGVPFYLVSIDSLLEAGVLDNVTKEQIKNKIKC